MNMRYINILLYIYLEVCYKFRKLRQFYFRDTNTYLNTGMNV